MTYYLNASVLIARGARYPKSGLFGTLAIVAKRQCRLHWLRTSLEERGV